MKKLLKVCDLHVECADPAIYVSRFVEKLELEEKQEGGEKTSKEHKVINLATLLLRRWGLDWMSEGRTRRGLAAAAVTLACRAHDYNRSLQEVSRISGAAVDTIRKRIKESNVSRMYIIIVIIIISSSSSSSSSRGGGVLSTSK